ncbi:hypothetical protein EPS65_05980 [Helcococcus ovis]|uniref:hypothetical protein n=1 Tax=Helcococcus ovis TaxID=72026 RepID=UPI002E7AB688|nr:hypothetical protein [Helcococcus ovis]WNZ00732.1 hypothetical protein EQF90_005580 [Helcococcus ovis]
MKIFIILLCLLAIGYNFYNKSKNLICQKLSPVIYFLFTLILFLGLTIWRIYDNTFLGLIIVLLFSILFISNFYSIGISNKHFCVFLPKLFLVFKIPFNKVKNITIVNENNKLKIIIEAYGDKFIQIYDLNYEKKFFEIINNNSNIKILN